MKQSRKSASSHIKGPTGGKVRSWVVHENCDSIVRFQIFCRTQGTNEIRGVSQDEMMDGDPRFSEQHGREAEHSSSGQEMACFERGELEKSERGELEKSTEDEAELSSCLSRI